MITTNKTTLTVLKNVTNITNYGDNLTIISTHSVSSIATTKIAITSIGIKGDSGATKNTFETIAKNINSYDYRLVFTDNTLTSIVFEAPLGDIIKTLNYTAINSRECLTSIVLSGATPQGIDLTKTIPYDVNGNIDASNITYS